MDCLETGGGLQGELVSLAALQPCWLVNRARGARRLLPTGFSDPTKSDIAGGKTTTRRRS